MATSNLPPDIVAYMESEEFKQLKLANDLRSKRISALANPLIEQARPLWRLLGFTEEDMRIQGGDPEIAFQCEVGGWVVRTDFSSEIGESAWFWQAGCEAAAVLEWKEEFFALGTPTRPPTEKEFEEHEWHMKEAIRSLAQFLERRTPS